MTSVSRTSYGLYLAAKAQTGCSIASGRTAWTTGHTRRQGMAGQRRHPLRFGLVIQSVDGKVCVAVLIHASLRGGFAECAHWRTPCLFGKSWSDVGALWRTAAGQTGAGRAALPAVRTLYCFSKRNLPGVVYPFTERRAGAIVPGLRDSSRTIESLRAAGCCCGINYLEAGAA
jgi:hypothetical protein